MKNLFNSKKATATTTTSENNKDRRNWEWFEWGVEAGLVTITAACLIKEFKDMRRKEVK